MSIRLLTSFVAAVLGGVGCADVHAQELDARISINHSQVQGTDASVFDDLEQNLTRFVNERQWTSMQFYKNERIQCSFNITVTKYDKASNVFTCKAVVQANRPVYNASYTTTLYSNTDNDFNFEYAQFDQIQFNEEQVDNQLTALMAYYAVNAIIGSLGYFCFNMRVASRPSISGIFRSISTMSISPRASTFSIASRPFMARTTS